MSTIIRASKTTYIAYRSTVNPVNRNFFEISTFSKKSQWPPTLILKIVLLKYLLYQELQITNEKIDARNFYDAFKQFLNLYQNHHAQLESLPLRTWKT